MLPVTKITSELSSVLSATKIKQLAGIITGILCVRYEVTTRGIARYHSYSLRSLFRFLREQIDWEYLRVLIFKTFVFSEDKHFIAAVDEVVEGKSRQNSYGIGVFYSSIAKKPINGICFFALTLIDVGKRCSYMISIQQIVFDDEDKKRNALKKAKKKEAKQRTLSGITLSKGRKKGTKNKAKQENNTSSYRTFKLMWNKAIDLIMKQMPIIKISHLVADSAYGTFDYLNLAKAHNCFLISKLSSNTALYEVYSPKKQGKGRPKMYGNKIDLKNLDKSFLKKTEDNTDYQEKTYQFKAYSKSIKGVVLNVVVVITSRKSDSKKSTNIWFTNDAALSFNTLLDYYSLRFLIEFDFRDAKQHFGLSDFKNYKQLNLVNFVNLSFLMCLISKILIQHYQEELGIKKLSVLDLKILFNARHTAKSILKLTQKYPKTVFNDDFCSSFVPEDLINAA